MHIPRAELWQEMLMVPQFIRLEFPFNDGDTRYPTLIIKGHSLLLKYIIQGSPLSLLFIPLPEERLAYALQINDDHKGGIFLWSLLADEYERQAIEDLAKHGGCLIYLFNELCANCAWTSVILDIPPQIMELATSSKVDATDPSTRSDEVNAILDRTRKDIKETDLFVPITISSKWNPIYSAFAVNGPALASLDLLFGDEGTYQEQLAHALLGDLSPRGAFINTKLDNPKGQKEFTDIVLTHEFGTILIESKALSVFEQRKTLPTREKLAKNIKKSVKKALGQLRGAVRTLRTSTPILNDRGETITLARRQPAHVIVLIPELDLLSDVGEELFQTIVEFLEDPGAFLHVLDTVELFRVMQAAQMISKNSKSVTPMAAFDFYLLERFKALAKARTANFRMLLRIKSDKLGNED